MPAPGSGTPASRTKGRKRPHLRSLGDQPYRRMGLCPSPHCLSRPTVAPHSWHPPLGRQDQSCAQTEVPLVQAGPQGQVEVLCPHRRVAAGLTDLCRPDKRGPRKPDGLVLAPQGGDQDPAV